jgi:hypothetical protein
MILVNVERERGLKMEVPTQPPHSMKFHAYLLILEEICGYCENVDQVYLPKEAVSYE